MTHETDPTNETNPETPNLEIPHFEPPPTDDDDPTPQEEATPEDITLLLDALTESMAVMGNPKNTLLRQTQILDTIFTKLVGGSLQDTMDNGGKDFDHVDKWLGLALKVQKQCNTTIKTQNAMDYINDIQSRMKSPPPL